jgi:PAS domain S-box-containing protein
MCSWFFLFLGLLPGDHVTKPVHAQNNCKKNVLVVHSYNYGYGWTDSIMKGIEAVLPSKQFNLTVEYMDTKKFEAPAFFQKLEDLYRYKFAAQKFDIIICSDDNAFNFLKKNKNDLFGPDPPVVFCGVNFFQDADLNGRQDITGVMESYDIAGTIEIIRILHPGLQEILVISDRTATGIANTRKVRKAMAEQFPQQKYTLVDDVAMAELLQLLGQAPAGTAALYLGYAMDKSGKSYAPLEGSLALISGRSRAPLYSVWEFTLESVVGGMITSGYYQGEMAAAMAKRLMEGERVAAMSVVKDSPNKPMFNYLQMQRFGISPSQLPDGSIMINRPDSFYDQHKSMVWAILSILLVLFLVVLVLTGAIVRQRRAEEALRESEEKYRQLMNTANDAIFIAEVKTGIVIDANQKAQELLNLPVEKIIGMHQSQLHPPEEAQRYQSIFKQHIEEGGQITEEIILINAEGRRIPVEISASVTEVKGRKLVQGIFRDVTERCRAEAELRRSEEQYRLLVNQVPAVVYKGYPDWSLDCFDRKIEEITGYLKEEFDSRRITWRDLIFPEDMAQAKKAYIAAHKGDGSYITEHRIRKKNGEVRWIQSRNRIIYDSEGKADHTSGVFFDITEHKRLEEERDRLFNMSMDMLCVAGFDGFFKQINPAWSKTLGWPARELLSRPYLDLVHPEDRVATAAAGERLKAGKPVIQFENRYQCSNGSYRWISWNSFPFPEEKLIFAVARDITEKRDMEKQFLEAQRMEAVGLLAGGVAHDFNNLLTTIMGYCDIMLLEQDQETTFSVYLKEIIKATSHGTSLTNQLLAFSRKQIMQPRVFDLNTILTDMDKMLHRLIGEDIDLVTNNSGEPGWVKADPGQIEQIIMNLVVNARDAMPQGGMLTIETKNVDLDEAYARRHMGVSPGPYVMLAVSDNGLGMDAETLSHIFEPFFTTKRDSKGTGLGLATVYGIVQQSSGHIWVYSEPGQGTTFKIYLPQVAEHLETVKPVANAAITLQGRETILVVEDEVPLRELISKSLRKFGYQVLTAALGSEALLICEEEKGPIHLLLTDVVMPHMSGRELVERLTPLHPEIKVIYMSGYTENAIVHHGVLDANINFIQKPFRVKDLVEKVREVLDRASPPREEWSRP